MTKERFYTVIEVQNSGTPGILTTVYTNENEAYSKYYTVLAAAALSTIPYHSGHIIRDDGVMIEGKVFDRRTNPTPAPEPEE